MATLLHVIATPNQNGTSFTRKLSDAFLDAYLKAHPGDRVVEVDLAVVTLPPLDAAGVAALFMPGTANGGQDPVTRRRRALDDVVAQFVAADKYLITTPMWNFGPPYPLKHYVDLVVQLGRTVRINGHGPEGMLAGRRAAVLISRGFDYGPGSGKEAFDLLEPWLRTTLGFMGITDLETVALEGTQLPGIEHRVPSALAAARALGARL